MPFDMGLATIGSGALGAVGSMMGQNSANQANKLSQYKSMKHQLYMSNTAHQRGVKDLEKAGLNRVLAAGGSMATTAQGASFQAQNEASDLASSVSNTAQNYLATKKQAQEIALLKAQTRSTVKDAEIKAGEVPKSKFKEDVGNDLVDGYKKLKKKTQSIFNKWMGTGNSAKNVKPQGGF